MPSLTVENYIKSIYLLSSGAGGSPAATGQLSAALGVSPGTVTSMLKTLGESGLVTYTPYEGVHLTPSGTKLALRVLRRHRLIELFLARTLGLSWDEVHEEAEHMEHSVSDRLIDRIDEHLGFPACDPHGDPIPTSDGELRQSDTKALVECLPGEGFRLARVLDQTPEFLRYLTDSGLTLGVAGQVRANHREAGIVIVDFEGGSATLGRTAAEKLRVEPLG